MHYTLTTIANFVTLIKKYTNEFEMFECLNYTCILKETYLVAHPIPQWNVTWYGHGTIQKEVRCFVLFHLFVSS